MTMSRRFFGLFRPFSTFFAAFFAFPHSKLENILETHEHWDKIVGFSSICGHNFSINIPNRINHQKHQFGPFDDLFSGSPLSIQIYSRNWLSSMTQSMWLCWETNGKYDLDYNRTCMNRKLLQEVFRNFSSIRTESRRSWESLFRSSSLSRIFPKAIV